jgi:hypothetical protein
MESEEAILIGDLEEMTAHSKHGAAYFNFSRRVKPKIVLFGFGCDCKLFLAD